jgi:hypothetical protein
VVSSTVIGWVWQFTLQSAQRHNQISKIGDIFAKNQYSVLAEPGSRERGIFDRLMFKMHYSKLLVEIRPSCFLTRWMQCLSKFFRKKLRVPPLVDPRAVEINIFADLTISKRQKVQV